MVAGQVWSISKEQQSYDQIKLQSIRNQRMNIYKLCIVYMGVSIPPQKHHPHLSCQAPHKSINCPSSPFYGILLNILFFHDHPPHKKKNHIFQWASEILKFFILDPILSFKSNWILSENLQFQFLVMTEKNIFVYKLFVVDFLCKNCTPPPHPPMKKFSVRSCQAPHFLEIW